MLKKLKAKLKKANNRGSSFVLVIVSTSFLCILVSALLMGMLLAYELKYYRLNSLDNFYSVEKAMDEIYAGIGASTNEHLYSAYTTTAELVVYYKSDETSSGYTYLTDEEANNLFRKLFIQGFADDDKYAPSAILSTIEGFITDDDVELSYDNLVIDFLSIDDDGLEGHQYVKYSSDGTAYTSTNAYKENYLKQITFKNVCVKRDVEITSGTASGDYVQSITTDIVLTEPEFNVSFDITSSNSDSLYNYALLADMGLEVDGGTDGANVVISGNIYTASDYYNKDYNGNDDTKVTEKYTKTATNTWGSTSKSLYSGIYVSGDNTSLTLMSDVIICSGTLAAFNGATVSLSGATGNLAELWTDNIVIGGSEDGSITMAADAYVYDDTELNAEGSSFTLMSGGRYFGYSYSSEDMRSIDYLSGEKNSVNENQATTYLSKNFSLKSHFGDSAIIINGEDSSLDLSSVDSLYIAGKSYIEFSRVAASTLTDASTEALEKMGLESKDILDDVDYTYTTLLDYSTGQSLDVKSNQLVFLANWTTIGDELTEKEVEDAELPEGYTYVKVQFPYSTTAIAENTEMYQRLKDLYADLNSLNEDGALYAIKQEVSGHTYYYLYIDDSKVDTTDEDAVSAAESFVEKYYAFVEDYGEDLDGIYNVVNYESFTVSSISLPDTGSMSTSGAVTATNDNSLYVTPSAKTSLNVGTALKSASTSKVFTSLLGGISTTTSTETNSVYESLLVDSSKASTTISTTAASGNNISNSQISDFLNYMYINLKDHLSVANATDDDGNEISAYELVLYTESDGSYSTTDGDGNATYNYSITPLNNFIDFQRIIDEGINITKTITWSDNSSTPQATVIVSNDDVTVDTNMTGIIISAGDVTFTSNATTFTGLIICGGKIICGSNMTISSSQNMVVSILDKCADDDSLKILTTGADKIFKNYESTSSDDDTGTSGVSISDISYYDILAFQNWKKNVE